MSILNDYEIKVKVNMTIKTILESPNIPIKETIKYTIEEDLEDMGYGVENIEIDWMDIKSFIDDEEGN